MKTAFFTAALICALFPIASANAETRDIVFPVIGSVNYTDDFGAPRAGHTHEGNDLLGQKLLKLVATVTGTVRFVAWPEPSYGYYVSIQDAAGYRYNYLHINNDTTGTDDGNGGGTAAYAPYIYDGAKVVAGQLIGWMGDSGNAESTTPHLHFEARTSDNTPFSPYDSLQAASHVDAPVAAPQEEGELLPYGEFTGGSHIALGNVDADAALEVISGAGPGGGPEVRTFDKKGKYLTSFFAYDEGFRGGVDVATGDANGDGVDEIITGAGPGGTPEVRIFRADGTFVRSFLAYAETFQNGITVAAGDIDGNGKAEIITGTQVGGAAQVRVFTPKGVPLSSFFAYDQAFRGGVDVAVRPASKKHRARIITAAGEGGSPEVRVFQTGGTLIRQFFAYDETFRGGVRVSVGNVDTTSKATEIMTVPASGGAADIRTFSLKGVLLDYDTAFEEWWRGGYDIAVGDDTKFISSGPHGRRASVRQITQQQQHYGR